AHYGLPTERPVDRHKWFFNTEQATAFFQHKAGATGCTLKEIVVTERRRNPVLTALRRMRYSTDAYNNRYANTVFALFEKQVQRAKSAA
ncbi:MAG: hypothetical protein KDA41_15420, partial [Planctomycetales bacterium]|nr:hypothetical protein [Planctomycetales bacterium]